MFERPLDRYVRRVRQGVPLADVAPTLPHANKGRARTLQARIEREEVADLDAWVRLGKTKIVEKYLRR